MTKSLRPTGRLSRGLFFARVAVLATAASVGLAACGPTEPVTPAGPLGVRRLSEEQYRTIIADVFGSNIVISGRFDPFVRSDGLLEAGAWKTSVTAPGFVQYEDMARAVAAQVVSEPNRDTLIPCKPAAVAAYDQACATTVLNRTGRLLFRRPLTPDETAAALKTTEAATISTKNFYDGLAVGLSRLLMAPDFLFVIDTAEADPKHPSERRLNAYSRASRLSFLLWNAAPDDLLLKAAEQGDLYTADGTARQVDRMLKSPRVKDGVRAFFADMLGFDGFAVLEKDTTIYPAFGMIAAQDAREQTLRTIVDLLVTHDGDYRDIFTTRKTFITRALGRLYQVRVDAPDGTWESYEFASDSPRVGIQTQLSLLALNAHPGKSSSTLRGRAIRTTFLCQKVPDPPGDVDFSIFSDPNSPNKTARQRLTAHATSAACVGCHKITDPIGLAMENFDGAGQFRMEEGGVTIDASGDLDGQPYADSTGLAKALHDHPAAPSCVVNRLVAYAIGKAPAQGDKWAAFLHDDFAAHGYRMRDLLRRVAASNAFFAIPQNDSAPRSTEQASASGVTP